MPYLIHCVTHEKRVILRPAPEAELKFGPVHREDDSPCSDTEFILSANVTVTLTEAVKSMEWARIELVKSLYGADDGQ
jgi:hypothetical protein